MSSEWVRHFWPYMSDPVEFLFRPWRKALSHSFVFVRVYIFFRGYCKAEYWFFHYSQSGLMISALKFFVPEWDEKEIRNTTHSPRGLLHQWRTRTLVQRCRRVSCSGSNSSKSCGSFVSQDFPLLQEGFKRLIRTKKPSAAWISHKDDTVLPPATGDVRGGALRKRRLACFYFCLSASVVLIAIVTAQHPPTLVVWETVTAYSVKLRAANEQKGRVNTALIHSMFIPFLSFLRCPFPLGHWLEVVSMSSVTYVCLRTDWPAGLSLRLRLCLQPQSHSIIFMSVRNLWAHLQSFTSRPEQLTCSNLPSIGR